MKAISPFVAAILLIAFTVGVGSIMAVWLPTLINTQTQTVSSTGNKAALCSSTTLTVKEVKYKSGSTLVNVTVEVTTGAQALRNVTVTVEGGGLTNSSTTAYTTSDFTAGQLYSTSVNTTSGATVPPSLVTVSSFCQTTYPVVAHCVTGDPCMMPS